MQLLDNHTCVSHCTYTLTETEAPAGYAIVKNAVFQVKYLSGTSGTGGTVIGTYLTSANGSFTVTGLKAGAYVVEELASDSGHVIDAAPQTAYISGEEQDVVQLYFGNAPTGSLLIKKIDSVTRVPLSDVRFFVTDSSGTVLGNANGYYVTDSAGTILIDGIAPGTTLIAKETRAKDGYVLDDTPQTAYIKAGQTVTLEFRNAPKGALIVQKYDSITKAPLAGAEFKITTASGELVPDNQGLTSSNDLYKTDANGQIVLSKLNPGTYVVTETKAPDNYKLDATAQTVVVSAADTQTLSFYNEPLCVLTILKRDAVTLKPLTNAFLKGFHGYLQADGYSGYHGLEGVTHVGCWAHARRKFDEACRAVPIDGRIELSNNRAERSIKPFVISRKNFLFANTARGAKSSAGIFSLIETAKENGLDPYRYLTWLFTEAPRLSQADPGWASKLLPWNAPETCQPTK